MRDKNSHLRAAQSDIQAIRDQIEERYIFTTGEQLHHIVVIIIIICKQCYRNNDRQLFMSKKLSIEEVRSHTCI